ncbi:hypothetical protein ACD975_23360, partial [Escherichia coli]
MHQSGSVSLCRSAISVLVATALYSPIALASTVEYGETVDGVVLEKDIQLVYGTANNTKINPGGEQHIKEFGVSNNTEINGGYQYIEMNGAAEYSVLNDGYQIVWICPYISRHLLSLNPLLACCRRYSRG